MVSEKEEKKEDKSKPEVKAYLHVVYAAFGDASILEFQKGSEHRFYLVDGGPILHVGGGGTKALRIEKITKPQLSKPYYQYLLHTLTDLATIPDSTGIKLNGALVTHPHADHLDGVERLFRELLPHQYQDSVKSDSPDKRLICNGPVLLTKKFAQKDEAYRSFSDFLLESKFEISLSEDDILNAFGNDIIFSFPASPGVLYQRHKPAEDDEPFSEDKQKSKLTGGTGDDVLNKSSIILCTKKGGKICLNGDAYGYDIAALLRKEGMKDLDIFKLPHHGSPKNSILGNVLPPDWAYQNLASMLLLSISLKKTIAFPKNPDEHSEILYLTEKLIALDEDGKGVKVQEVAEAFKRDLEAQLKKLSVTTEDFLENIKEKHITIVTAIQKQTGDEDPCKDMEPLAPLKDWETLKKNVAKDVMSSKPSGDSERSKKALKVDKSTFVGDLMGNNNIYQDFYQAKIGVDMFFESFDSKTYYVSANGRHEHPSPDVVRGIIKAAVKKNKPCKIVFTSGGALPSKYLPDVHDKGYENWNKLVALYFLKNNVSFKLDPSSDANVAPPGTEKYDTNDKIRIDVAEQLKRNFGFTIPQRSFLPTLDKYYVKTESSDGAGEEYLWLKVNKDGKLALDSTKGSENVLIVSNSPSINEDLRMITLKSESDDGSEKNVWLEKAKDRGFLIKGSADGDYFFEDAGSVKTNNKKSKASVFFFEHAMFPKQVAPPPPLYSAVMTNRATAFYADEEAPANEPQDKKEISIVEFLRRFGYTGHEELITVRSVLEIFLGMPNVKCLIEKLPNDFIGIEALKQKVNLQLSTVEMSSSVDGEVVSSHIEVTLPTTTIMFDAQAITKLAIVVEEPGSSSPTFRLLIQTSLSKDTVDLSGYLKPKEPSVDMYLNAIAGVPLEGRNNMTLGTLLEHVMGLLPLEDLSNCIQTQLLASEIFTWKVDRDLSTVNYFISPLTVEVLSGNFYVSIPPEKKRITFADKVTADLSSIHVMVSDPRTYKSNFTIECDASIGSVPVNMKMTSTSTNVPEVTISFPESFSVANVFTTLALQAGLHDLSVPLVNKAIKSLALSNPRITVVQDVQNSKVTRVSSLSFNFSFQGFASLLPQSLPQPQDSRASFSIFNPLSGQIQLGVKVEFKLPVSSASEDDSFLNSKFVLWPVDVSTQQSQRGYLCSVSIWPSSSGISLQSVLAVVGLGYVTKSMTSSFPFISSILSGVLLNEVTLEVNTQSRSIESFALSLSVPECSIIEDKLSMHDASLLVQYGANEWYAETEMKLLVFNKFVCHAAFSLPRPNVPGSLTFQNTETSFTFKEFVEGIGIVVPDDIPIISEVLDVKISKVAINCENNGSSFKITEATTVLEKRTLTIGRIKLYNLELEVCYANTSGNSSVSFSLQGYLNPNTHAVLAYDAEKRELLGRYVLTSDSSTNDFLKGLFQDEMNDFSSSNAYDQVKSLHVQEVKVVLSFPRGKKWELKEFILIMKGSLSLGPFNLQQLRIEYARDPEDDAERHISVAGNFKSDKLSFTMKLSCTSKQSSGNIFEAIISPDSAGGVTLSSLLQLIGLTIPDVPQVEGSPDFFEVELKEALLQFQVSPFRIRKVDVVIKTSGTLKILEKPNIQVHDARLEYHYDDTSGSAQTHAFISGVFLIAGLRLDVILSKDTDQGLVLEGRLQKAENFDFKQAATQLSPDVPFSLPKNVALSSFSFQLKKSEEITSLKLEGESNANWSIDAGFATFTVKHLGGKLNYRKERDSAGWSGFVCLTGEVLLLEEVVVAVEVYHDSKGETLAFGTVHELGKIDLEVMTQKFAAGSDSSKSWDGLVPDDTKSSVRSPKFNSASLLIDVSNKTLLFYGSVKGFGTGLLMVKKEADEKESSTKYGFLFGLSLGSDFNFSSINNSLSVVDDVLTLQQANLSVISMDHVTVSELREDFAKLQGLEHHQEEVEVPFTEQNMEPLSDVQVERGMTAFAKVSFSGAKSKLVSNVTQIQKGEELADIVLFAHISSNAEDTIFKAQIEKMNLFGGNLKFDGITLTYQPCKSKTFTLSGEMSLKLTDDSTPIVFSGSLEISEEKANFSMTVGKSHTPIDTPFGMRGISFEDPKLQLSWQFDDGNSQSRSVGPSCSISGTVNFSKSASSEPEKPATSLTGSILFQEGKPVVASIALTLDHPLSIDDLFHTLFKEQWPSGYLDISFKEGEIYCAKDQVEMDSKTYKKGFHGQTEIDIFGKAFGVEISVDQKGMSVKGYTKFEIDLDIATLTGTNFEQNRGPEIEISRYDGDTKFQLSTGVKILQEKIGTCSVGYDVTEKCFQGGVKYDGELLGVTDPSIEFEWSKKNGFKITKWPLNLDLNEIIDFAKEFEKLSQLDKGPCEKLVGLAFDKVIKTKCRVEVKQVPAKEKEKDAKEKDAWFSLELQGKLDIMIVTETPAVTVDFPKLTVTIDKPPKQFHLSDLPEFLIKEIGKNSLQIAKQVFSQPEKLTEFMAALGGIKLSRKILSGLICRGCRSKNVTDQAEKEGDNMEKDAEKAEDKLDSEFEDFIAAAEGGEDLSSLASGAASVIEAAGDVVSAFGAIISFLAGIVTWLIGKSKKQKEAEKRQKEAREKAERARELVEDRLAIEDLTITLSKPNEVEISWKKLDQGVMYNVSLTRTDLDGTKTDLLQTRTLNNTVSFDGDQIKYGTTNLTANVQASYLSHGKIFTGTEASRSKGTEPLLRVPSKVEVESKQKGREVHVTFSQVQYAVDYKAEVLTHDDKVIGSAIIKLPSEDKDKEDKDGMHVFHADELTAGIPGETRVRVCARGHGGKLNDFKYSTDLYLVEAPSDILRSYNTQSEELDVKWKVKDKQNISSYQCEVLSVQTKQVVFTKEVAQAAGDSLESSLSIVLDEISDKAKSPYRIRVCSLGGSASVASVFVDSNDQLSFLSHVDSITPVYDSQSNLLTVSWVAVPEAKKYKVAIEEEANKSCVAGTLISEENKTEVVFDMGKIQLKSGVKYVVTVVAEGLDALHLPGVPFTADKKFTQLQTPGSVTQKYSLEEKQLKVTFQSAALASAHLIEVFDVTNPLNLAGKHVYPKATDHDDDQLPSTITYSFDVKDMRFTGGDQFKSRVTALGNETLINSLPSVSTSAIPSYPSPEDVSITFDNNIQHMVVSCSSVKDAVTFRFGVVDANKLKNQEMDIEGALLGSGWKEVALSSSDIGKPVEAEFDKSVLISSLDGIHKGVAQVIEKQKEVSLPSGFSISENEVTWLKAAAPIKMSYDPDNATLRVTWTSVTQAIQYMVEILQKRQGNDGATTTLTPFSKKVSAEALFCSVSIDDVNFKESDKFIAKVQPYGTKGSVIPLRSVGYSDALACESTPTDVKVIKVEDNTVKVTWKGDADASFQLRVWKMLKSEDQIKVITMQTDKTNVESTPERLSMDSPGMYRIGVRAQGSINKLPSVYTDADFLAVIMDAPVVTPMRQRPGVTVQWTSVDIKPTQGFSHYVIWYRKTGTETEWNQVQVEMSASEKTIVDLQPDSDYQFCISVASSKQGNGILSPTTSVHTDIAIGKSIKLYIEPNDTSYTSFGKSNADLKAEKEFKKAVVKSGTWIFYTYTNYNDAQNGGNQDNYKVLKPGDVEDISNVNGSMYLLEDAVEGVILFEHVYYGGTRKYYLESCADVNTIFPHGQVGGVSAAIVLSKNTNFEIFPQTNYEGKLKGGLLEAGKWYPTPDSMDFANDTVQSIRKGKSIKLYIEPNDTSYTSFGKSNADLKAEKEFKKAVVTSGTWIFYTYTNYNDAQNGGNQDNYKVLKPGDVEDISNVNGSMYLLEDAVEGVILFEHVYYGGTRKYYLESCADVNTIFPHGQVGGVSAAIVLSKNTNFEIFPQTNYEGKLKGGLLEAGKWYPTPGSMDFANDTVQSIRKGKSIKLYIEPNDTSYTSFGKSNADLKAEKEFKKAVVTSGTWIFYTYTNYNDAQNGGNQDNYKVLKPGDVEDISNVNGSMYLLEDAVEGVILFEHVYYGGTRKYYLESCADVNTIFPHGQVGGVSAAIVLSKNTNFEIFPQTNYEGKLKGGLLEAGKWYPTPGSMDFSNDTVQSIRKK